MQQTFNALIESLRNITLSPNVPVKLSASEDEELHTDVYVNEGSKNLPSPIETDPVSLQEYDGDHLMLEPYIYNSDDYKTYQSMESGIDLESNVDCDNSVIVYSEHYDSFALDYDADGLEIAHIHTNNIEKGSLWESDIIACNENMQNANESSQG